MSSNDNDQIHALSQRILIQCAERLGGAAALAKHLGVAADTLADWLSGKHVPPVEAIAKAITPLLGEPLVAEPLQEQVRSFPIPKARPRT